MKYTNNTALGDAGEFLFAFRIARTLKWPCRLFDIDIGIDAQVEVLDGEQSTGRFVAFQIKASTQDHGFCRYVKKKQLSYWQELDIPVFAVLVDLRDHSMYLHLIKKGRDYHITTNGEVRIDFDKETEVFNDKSAELIKAAAEEQDLTEVIAHLAPVFRGADKIKLAIANFDSNPDPERAIELMRGRFKLKEQLGQAKVLAKSFGVGELAYAEASEQLSAALDDLRDYMKERGFLQSWDDFRFGNGDIRKFVEE